jgi:hypothetical protein
MFILPQNRMTQLNIQALDSVSFASYDPKDYGGGFRNASTRTLKTKLSLKSI